MKHTTLSACLFAGLVSATSLVLDAQPGPDYATRDLFTQGEFFIGCNYWAKNAGMYMWSRWRPDIVEKELEELAKNGVQVMRVFPLWPDFSRLLETVSLVDRTVPSCRTTVLCRTGLASTMRWCAGSASSATSRRRTTSS